MARAREFIETPLADSRKALKASRVGDSAYKNSGGTFDLKSEYNEMIKSVSDLESTLAKTEVKLAGRRLRPSALTSKRART